MSPIMLMMSLAFQSSVVPVLTISAQLDSESCDTPKWIAGLFGFPGPRGGSTSLAVFDEGSGPMLFVGGGFEAGGLPTNGIARWDGRAWSTVGGGLNIDFGVATYAIVGALAVHDLGSGPALYAGGQFDFAGDVAVSNIAQWDGNSWSTLSGGVTGRIWAMSIFDSGNGPELYAGGTLSAADGIPVQGIAKWNGSMWSAVGTDYSATIVPALTTMSDSTGSYLYAARSTSGSTPGLVDRWDGVTWSPVGMGFNYAPRVFGVYDDGTGPALYTGGYFTLADGVPCNRIAKWNGQSWEPLTSGVDDEVLGLNVVDFGQGPRLLVSGRFYRAGGIITHGVALWDGQVWSAAPAIDGFPHLRQLVSYNDGHSTRQYAVGYFYYFHDFGSSQYSISVIQWNNDWETVGQGLKNEIGDSQLPVVTALKAFDEQSSTQLYATIVEQYDDSFVGRAARWDGRLWHDITTNLTLYESGPIYQNTFAEFDDGHGNALYLGGNMVIHDDHPGSNIAKWNGQQWELVGGGTDDRVTSMVVIDDGTGPALIVGGRFQQVGDVHSRAVAKWDGQSWSVFDTGLPEGELNSLTVFDDGHGPTLYAGGRWQEGPDDFTFVYRWSGAQWERFGFWNSELLLGTVNSLAVFDDGTGPKLYAGGEHHELGSSWSSQILQWSNGQWTPLPATFTKGSAVTGPSVLSLTVLDDGSGPALYALGVMTELTTASGEVLKVNGTAKWNGQQWLQLDNGLRTDTSSNAPAVYSAATFDDGTGNALFFGGSFKTADGWPSVGLAKWGCDVHQPIHGDLDFDGHVALDDLAALTNCFNGPNPTNNDCAKFDPHPDFDMDLQDFAVLQRNFSAM